METLKPYQPRSIRFLELIALENQRIKLYSISCKNSVADQIYIDAAKEQLPHWLDAKKITGLPVYETATLMVHEGWKGCFAVVFWWTDENMIQLFAYFSEYKTPPQFRLISNQGLISCVWEMTVLWFERQAWVKEVLMRPHLTDRLSRYLEQHLNEDL